MIPRARDGGEGIKLWNRTSWPRRRWIVPTGSAHGAKTLAWGNLTGSGSGHREVIPIQIAPWAERPRSVCWPLAA